VTEIRIDAANNISLQLLGQAFPNVETAAIFDSTFVSATTGGLIWPKLKQLTVSACQNMQWGISMARNITHLSCGDDVNEDVVSFIASHKSLEVLDIWSSAGHIHSIATKAPQLLSLTVDACPELADSTKIKLSKLTHLGIYDTEDIPLSLELFEKIVKARFLPKKGGRKTLAKSGPISLEIVVDMPSLVEGVEWDESELIAPAHKETFTLKRWNYDYRVHKFQWN
jgi:hypothetical protein